MALAATLGVLLGVGAPAYAETWTPLPSRMVIAHRGASGYLPENTLAAYRLALDLGADAIEPDLVVTKDGVLIARHENELSKTTDVAEHPEFADRLVTKVVQGVEVTGWFSEDFTYAEIATLTARERYPVTRPDSAEYDGTYTIPRFWDIVVMAQQESAARGRTIWVIPEIKAPAYFRALGFTPEVTLLGALRGLGWAGPAAPVIIQSYSVSALKMLNKMTPLRLGRVIESSRFLTRKSLRRTRTYADSVFIEMHRVIPSDSLGYALPPTLAVRRAKARGFSVFVWTLRAENRFLYRNLWIGEDPLAQGDMISLSRQLWSLGVNGVLTDNSDLAVASR